jgi:membrane fusion protein, heavy metal efflux system
MSRLARALPRWSTTVPSIRVSLASLLGVAGAAGFLAGCEGAGDAKASRIENPPAAVSSTGLPQGLPLVVVPPESPRFKQLRIATVETQSFVTEEVVAPARITINPNRMSRVLPFVQGRVLTVPAKLGDTVEQGQALVTMDSPDADAAVSAFLQAEATERQTRVTLAKTGADLTRARKLFEAQAGPEKDVLSAQNDLATALTALDNAQANTSQTRRKLELLGLKPNDFHQPVVVRAPISGVITDISVTPGEYRGAVMSASDATAPLMSVADLSTVWVSSDVPEPFIRFVRVGEPVSISLVAYPGETFTGRVARLARTLDPQTRTLKVHVDLPNPAGRFVPEMFGTIRHEGPVRRLPVVPAAAIVQEYGRPEVFVERGPGQFERRSITTGGQAGEVVAVLAGLEAGARVVVDGAPLLKGQ